MAFRLSPHLTVMANAAQKASKRLLRDFAEVEQLQVTSKARPTSSPKPTCAPNRP